MVKRHVFQFVPTNMSTYVQHKGLYATYSSWHIDPWNNRKVWVDKYFSDDQLIFFLFGQEETITQDHHICLCRSQWKLYHGQSLACPLVHIHGKWHVDHNHHFRDFNIPLLAGLCKIRVPECSTKRKRCGANYILSSSSWPSGNIYIVHDIKLILINLLLLFLWQYKTIVRLLIME